MQWHRLTVKIFERCTFNFVFIQWQKKKKKYNKDTEAKSGCFLLHKRFSRWFSEDKLILRKLIICIKAYSIFQCMQLTLLKMLSGNEFISRKVLGKRICIKKKHEITRISWEEKTKCKTCYLKKKKLRNLIISRKN